MTSLRDEVYTAYRDWSSASAALIEEAREVFPGGDTRMSAHFAPYPLFIERAEGPWLHDADGHRLLDFMNNFTSLIHGHANPAVVQAVQEQVTLGSAYAAPTRSQVALGRLIVERVPSVEQLRFTSSGTEATLMALRCARAFSGRQKIMKMEGGYHGSFELAEVSLVPHPDRCGPLDAPHPVPVDRSIPDSVLADTVVCPYNQPEIARRLIERHAGELAAVIVEPALGSMGMIPASEEFLRALREATAAHDVLLIFDEVITLRAGYGGAQGELGITPDLTAMGKIIGGGLPIGAVGGRRELMRMFHPDEAEPVMHASTFSGNPLSMAAGHAAMGQLDPQTLERLAVLGERFREGVGRVFRDNGLRGQATGLASLSNIHWTDAPVNDARDSLAAMAKAGPLPRLLHLSMLRRGVASAGRLMYCLSTPMTAGEVDTALDALDDALRELRPGIERERPELLL
ncbi:MAG: aspartate aminotransferase family protein [Gammaproteobacteria bacterium]|jgi:glutamate-1-semialdehyde 2,1-aminomutase|nr:aspartate aminotransferase family protein [Gammaproteobacteria bacterium]|tara:strand:- start:3651 stop:5027 length:1377 start_codon:yes stop_codon:yes gene_type:complete